MPALVEEREVNLAAPAHDLAPRIHSCDPADFPVPTGREEEWRFTPLRRLRGLHDGSFGAAGVPAGDIALSWSASGASVEVVPRTDPRVGRWFTPTDRVSAQAMAGITQAAVVSIPAAGSPDDGTGAAAGPALAHLALRAQGPAEGALFGHVVVEVGAGARATVVLDHLGAAGPTSTNVAVHVDRGAKLTLVTNHLWDPTAVHVGHQHVVLAQDGELKSVVVTLGGDVVRHSATVDYLGRGGRAELLGVYFTDAGQHQEHRLFVDHSVPDCRSDVVYKGALQGADAHAVWIGDVLIRAAATGTRTYELNRNLVLTEGARADSVPNLEIETGQIEGAGHASATGRFDDEQLFYLQSRGLPPQVARRLVVRGFFADAISRISDPAVAAELMAAVEAKLGEVDPLFDFQDAVEAVEVAEVLAEELDPAGGPA